MKRRMNKEALVDALLRKALYYHYSKEKMYGADYYTMSKDITKYFAMKMPKYVIKKLLGYKYVAFATGFDPLDDDEDKVYETLSIAYGDSLQVDGVIILYNGLAEGVKRIHFIIWKKKTDRDYYM